MRKLFTILIPVVLLFSACNSSNEKTEIPTTHTSEPAESFFPVTDFLKGQLRELDSMPVTPLKISTMNGRLDSAWLKRENIREFAAPFLQPWIDSASMSSFFSGKSFLDQTINAITFSYDAKTKLPDSINLRHWDVYIDPQENKVQRIYLVKENTEGNITVTTQLTWKSNQWCSVRTITQKPGETPVVKEEKLIWDF